MNPSKHTHQVAVIAYVYRDGKFLLLKRNHPPRLWAPPGGRLLPDEDPRQGIIREVKEETGFDIRILHTADVWFGEWLENSYLMSIDFLVEITGGDFRLSEEHSDYCWVSLEQLINGEPILLNDPEGFQIADFQHAEGLLKLLRQDTSLIEKRKV